MGGWYTVGVFLGLGVAAGVLLAGLLGSVRAGVAAAAVLAAAATAGAGAWLYDVPEAVAGGLGGVVGALGVAPLVRAARARGGTLGGTALLLGAAALVLAAFAFVPVVGYVYAVAVPALAARVRRRADRTHAGLRILARD